MVRFDAYTATTLAAKPDDLMQLLLDVGGLGGMELITKSKGHHTFGERLAIRDGCGEWAAIQHGGRQGDRVMLEVKGERTPEAVEALRARFEHRCTRVDACADFDAPRAFEKLHRACRAVKKAHGIYGEKYGDWEDHPEKGRTFYLGAKSSPTRMRLYEKGLQPQHAFLERPNWARLELQVRPVKDAKEMFSSVTPMEVWGSSRWSRAVAASVLMEHVDPHPAGTVYRETERDAALRWMCKQYGAHLLSLADDLGSWDCVGRTLSEIITEHKRSAARRGAPVAGDTPSA